MYKIQAQKNAKKIMKQMERFQKMITTMDANVYTILDKAGYKIDLLGGKNGKVLVTIYRK